MGTGSEPQTMRNPPRNIAGSVPVPFFHGTRVALTLFRNRRGHFSRFFGKVSGLRSNKRPRPQHGISRECAAHTKKGTGTVGNAICRCQPCRRRSQSPFSAILLALLLPTVALAADDSADERFLAGLRQRSLYQLAEKYCHDRLDDPDLDDAQRAILVIERSRCLAEWAASSSADVRGPLWDRATKAIDDFAQQNANHPRRLPIRLQGALAVLARGELARQEAQVVAERDRLLLEARTHVRTAIRRLRELSDQVDADLRLANMPGGGRPPELSSRELASLRNRVQYELARAYRNQARCYDAKSADRSAALAQAIKLLDLLARLDPADPLLWKSRLDLIRCYRLVPNETATRRLLGGLEQQQPPDSIRLRARAEHILLALAAGRLDEATGVMKLGRAIGNVTSPELDLAWLDAYLRLWREAVETDDQRQADASRAGADGMVRLMESLYGPYWSRRAEMLLAGSVRATPEGTDLAMLVRAAESSYRSGRLDDSMQAYDRAATLATEQGDPNKAFELGHLAATIEHQRDAHASAGARYRRIATTLPSHEKAAGAHLLAVFHAAQLAKERPDEFLDTYRDLLREHLKLWPQGPSTGPIQWQLGRLHEYERQWTDAIAAFRMVPPDSDKHVLAVEAAGRCWRRWLAELQADGQPTQAIAQDAVAWFESLLIGPDGRLSKQFDAVAQKAVLELAQLQRDHIPSGHAPTQTLLRAVIDGSPDASPKWKSTARAMLVHSLAAGDRPAEAAEVLTQLSAGSAGELLELLQGLSRAAATAEESARSELAQLQLSTIRLLAARRNELDAAAVQSLERIHAQAMADVARTDKSLLPRALAKYQAVAETYSTDATIQEAYAQFLLRQNDPELVELALQKWRELERRSPQRSRRWFLAKYSMADAHHRLGDDARAVKIITLLQLVHSDLGGPTMEEKFLELLKACRR